MKDITFGQYFPGASPIHKLDPRFKILLTIALIVGVYTAQNIYGFVLVSLFLAVMIFVSQIRASLIFKSIKPIFFIICFTSVINLFYGKGGAEFNLGFITITERGIYTAVFMALRLIFMVVTASLLTYTTSPISLTGGIERLLSPLKLIRVPVHEIAMMMTIALRFIPTLSEEADKIIMAQKSRGADFESGSIFKRIGALVPILVPLIVSAFRRADELAMSMECRCYNGGDGRTRLHEFKAVTSDYVAVLIIAVFIGAILWTNYFGVITGVRISL